MVTPTATCISLLDAARRLVGEGLDEHGAELLLARAIEHGELPANIKRWSTEQWEGRQLPGNLNRLETFIETADLEQWTRTRSLPQR